MAELRVTELDFQGIKQNLKEYLASQDEFSDYNFEGSAMSVLLDVLAYNTHYNATLAHLLANEMFLDSALKRSSVVSIAKTMGYLPNSQHCARAVVSLEVLAPLNYEPDSLTLSKDTTFTATGIPSDLAPSGTYSFKPDDDYTVVVSDTVGSRKTFTFSDINLIEGNRVANSFFVDSTNLSGPFIIPNKNVDITTVKVSVQTSSSEDITTTFNYSDTYLNIQNNTNAFWIEMGYDGLYQIVFGDNVLGKQLEYGNIITVEYFVGSADGANNLSNFSLRNVLTGTTETKTIETITRASGGTQAESIDSIKFHAPKFNTTRDRAVTADDYATLIKRSFPGINSISVWGGEINDPPIYGKVFVCLDPVAGTVITETDKDTISRDIIAPKSVVSIQPVFVDPEYTFISVNSTIKYDPKKTLETSAELATRLRTTIVDHFDLNVNKLTQDFYYSKLSADIMDTSASIITNKIDITLHKRFTGVVTNEIAFKLDPNFGQSLQPNSLRSTYFNTFLNGVYYDVYLVDVPDQSPPDPLGTGTIYLKQLGTDVVLSSSFGTIDYGTGKINIPKCYFISLLGGANAFRIYVKPQNVTSDITTKILTGTMEDYTGAIIPTASRNSLLKLDQSSSNSAANIPTGLQVTVTT
jgi:hypothetical protein